jgi:transcription-repair coupling factor (superfamily II helicase)
LTLKELRNKLPHTDPFQRMLASVGSGRSTNIHGLAGSLNAFLLDALRRGCDRQILAITPTTRAAEVLRDDLESLIGEKRVRYFPDWELIAFEDKSPHVEVTALRLETMQALLVGEPVVVIAPITALLRPTLEPEALAAASRVINVGDQLDLDDLARWLRSLSFEPENQVSEMGQYARRGGIIDIFTFGAEHPYRVELFDDEVESIREFDPATQRSLRSVDEMEVLPRREVLAGTEWWGDAAERIEAAEQQHGVNLKQIHERVDVGVHFDGMEFWNPLISGEKPSLFDHIDNRTIVYIEEPGDVEHHAERFAAETEKLIQRRMEREETALPYESVFHTWEHISQQIEKRVMLTYLELTPEGEFIEFGAKNVRQYEGNLGELQDDMVEFARTSRSDGSGTGKTLLLAENSSQAQRLEELLERAVDLCDILTGEIHNGFMFPAADLLLLNDHEIFSRYRGRHRYRKYRGTSAVRDIFALKPGDIIVHEDHGVGIYQGIERLTVDGVTRDLVRLLYRDNDKLFLPVEQVDRIQRFSGDDEARPAISKLGGADWERAKARTKKGAVKLAKELIELYARRQSQPGFPFSTDSHWMSEMEAAFVYEETRDQLTTIQQIKDDMEKAVPMDRLVCGDVGFGKTEVAIRAAFKAVLDQKQVAILVPTTILAQQHYRTFCERLADFPVRVEMLSRFRTKQQVNQTLGDLARGAVDIVVGTHRLLSQDVGFKDLGLLIIDEEHRFGVKHKERLKHMRSSVDVLSMTATPIPRTLYLSLTGARDMSVINTPPRDRLPVHTEIVQFDEDRVSEAILREIDRDGQVFFLHNRVQTIEERMELLTELLPDVRFRIAHGQMGERQLERVMLDFMEHKFDVLITTMIIQSGLDIPNANTIIMDRADWLGLAELYQLRGRVGRSAHRAFAYLMVPKDRKLKPDARRRLRAIEEFSDLGSGFKVAMRDLEIRGAGNLLGNEQTGHITAVGYDMYVKLLEEAIQEIKGEVADSAPDCDVETGVSAYLPDEYVTDGEQKMALYRRLAESRSLDEVDAFSDELRDRYGRLPDAAHGLTLNMKLKVVGRRLGARKLSVGKSGRIRIQFHTDRVPSQQEIMSLVQRSDRDVEFKLDEELTLEMMIADATGTDQASLAVDAVQTLIEDKVVKAA